MFAYFLGYICKDDASQKRLTIMWRIHSKSVFNDVKVHWAEHIQLEKKKTQAHSDDDFNTMAWRLDLLVKQETVLFYGVALYYRTCKQLRQMSKRHQLS